MGEMAEYMLNGDDCQYCGEYLGDGDGFPRSCASCADEEENVAIKGKTLEQWGQSITDKTISAIKLHGDGAHWSKADHKRFADALRAVIKEGLEFKPIKAIK